MSFDVLIMLGNGGVCLAWFISWYRRQNEPEAFYKLMPGWIALLCLSGFLFSWWHLV